MSRLINIDDERFWDVLFDEVCVEGNQSERIKTELERIVVFDTEKVVEQLKREAERWESSGKEYNDRCEIAVGRGLRNSINIVKKGGVE